MTCVNFNPINDNVFISGSIDGKVRIWEVVNSRVSDYIDIREIVTAVCFRPDGKVCFTIHLTENLWQENMFCFVPQICFLILPGHNCGYHGRQLPFL